MLREREGGREGERGRGVSRRRGRLCEREERNDWGQA